jgi:hypothetical protein
LEDGKLATKACSQSLLGTLWPAATPGLSDMRLSHPFEITISYLSFFFLKKNTNLQIGPFIKAIYPSELMTINPVNFHENIS